MTKEKYCQRCQKLIIRKSWNRHKETDMEYAMRVYCGKACHLEAMKYPRVLREK